jgi:Ca-activated chloride channel family protein
VTSLANALPNLASPAWLLLLLVLPALAWRYHRRMPLGALTYSRLPAATGGGWRLHLPFYSRLLALGCLALALARPQLGYAWEESLTEGIDIQLVLDVSGSMGAEDFEPNRLTVAKKVVRDFVAGRTGDRLGLTTFSGSALTRAPLTTDHAMLDFLINSVQVSDQADGTAIGVALASAAARLTRSPAKSKVVVLVTDGANNAGQIDPISAAAICQGLKIKVYTVGVGTNNGPVTVPLPRLNPLTGQQEVVRVQMNAPLDEPLLGEIARRTGGRFFRATDPASLQQIFAAIDRLEKTEIKVKRYVRYRETFAPLAWSALALLLLPLGAAAARVTAEP